MTIEDVQDKWKIQRRLGGGAQGSTFLVQSTKEPDLLAVMKTQVAERQRDIQSRLRMNQEVANLQLLAETAAKVPRVLDSNTHLFATDADLYFVMDFVTGASLSEIVKRAPLSLNQAVGLTLDLLATIDACHKKGVMHRDIKPANLIVRSIEHADVVIVDYGLSFNEAVSSESDLTTTDEAIGNGFTDLPERRTPGAQRRYESDLTAACGILYFCLTGQEPKPFRDAFGKPPHRRQDPPKSLRAALKGAAATQRLELLLDQAFESDISQRFGSAGELIARLKHSAETSSAKVLTDLTEILTEGSSRLLKTSRRAQLTKIAQAAEKVVTSAETLVAVNANDLEFQCHCFRGAMSGETLLPSEVSNLHVGFTVIVQIPRLNESRRVEYAFGARANQAVLFRRRWSVQSQDISIDAHDGLPDMAGMAGMPGMRGGFGGVIQPGSLGPTEDWQARIWYPGEGEPDEKDLRLELQDAIQWQVEDLIEHLRE